MKGGKAMQPWDGFNLGELGTVVIGEAAFPVKSLRLNVGEVRIAVEIPPSEDEIRGHIRVYSPDGQRVSLGKIYRVPARDFTVEFEYGLHVATVAGFDEEVDLSKLFGWDVT